MTTSNTGGARPRFAYVGGFIVFDIDLEHCPQCGGDFKIIAAPSTGSGQASKSPP